MRRVPILALAMISLLAATWGGLVRIGWALPPLHPGLGAVHGPLMVSGFLGTLIGVERAVALRLGWAYVGPLATGLGAMALIAGLERAGAMLIGTGSVVLLALFARLFRRQPETFLATMALGMAAWAAGNLLWLAGRPIDRIVAWWAAFLVLVIAGERQELTRLLPVSRAAQHAFRAACGVLLAGVALGTLLPGAGMRVAGAGMVGIALWLARHDMARRTVHQPGLPRFMAVALLSGYAWLGAAGLLALVLGDVVAGPHYDALLHALFLGFVFAMIFAHAPVIFPGILGLPIAFGRRFYVHLVALHLGLALRLVGDLVGVVSLRRWGALLNALAIVLFLANTASSIRAAPAR